MLKKDLVATVERLQQNNEDLISEKRELDRECVNLKDLNNGMKLEIGNLKRKIDKALCSINTIMAVKHPTEFTNIYHDRCADRNIYLQEQPPIRVEDCPEEFRFLVYLKTILRDI